MWPKTCGRRFYIAHAAFAQRIFEVGGRRPAGIIGGGDCELGRERLHLNIHGREQLFQIPPAQLVDGISGFDEARRPNALISIETRLVTVCSAQTSVTLVKNALEVSQRV